uniref:RAI1-like domain-containing protein n=1 Tax=Glossina palpalis gambiensis TaxID=67801 RepID=A0A1B0BMR9_9MUSC
MVIPSVKNTTICHEVKKQKMPSKNPDVNEPVDERAEFACVFQTRLQSLNLLYSAEMDGIMSHEAVSLDCKESNLGPLEFVEIKVREAILTIIWFYN